MALSDFKATILVTGANGQLARELKVLSGQFPASRFLFASREELPIEDAGIVESFFEEHRIDYCINCAGYTAVDKAETEQDRAFLINGDAAGQLAKISYFHKARFIHISTDYVYDGSAAIPLKETDPTGPLNVYGASKLKGEIAVVRHNPSALIIRTSWIYSSFGSNFVKTMLRLFREKEEVSIVSDQYGCPTYAADLAEAIMRFVERMEEGTDFSGIVNYCNAGAVTWYEFAEKIKSITRSTCTLIPVPSASYKTAAVRPGYSVLDTTKIREWLQLTVPPWEESLQKCLTLLGDSH
jgi:dTDP-4-dehydrorhamnose reductase